MTEREPAAAPAVWLAVVFGVWSVWRATTRAPEDPSL